VFLLGVVHHRLARREDSLGIDVAGRVRQVADHVLLDFLGRIEAERGKVADVQLDDLVALFLHLPGAGQHGPADVVADVGELGGFAYGLHGQPSFRNHAAEFPRPEKQAPGDRAVPARTVWRSEKV
jgi:hypothetical protein